MGSERDHLDPAVERSTGRRHRVRPGRPLLLHGRRHQRDPADARGRRRPGAAQQPQLLRPRRGVAARAGPGRREPGLGGRRQQGRPAGARRAASTMVAERVGVPVDLLHGAGESQIVAPDGTVVAIGAAHRRGRRGRRHRRRGRRRQAPPRRHRRDGVAPPRALRPDRRRARSAGSAPAGADELVTRGRVPRPTATTYRALLARGARDRRRPRGAARARRRRPDDDRRRARRAPDALRRHQRRRGRRPRRAGASAPTASCCASRSCTPAPGTRLGRPRSATGSLVARPAVGPARRRRRATTRSTPRRSGSRRCSDVDVVAVPFTVAAGADLDPLLLERAAENRLNVAVASRGRRHGAGALDPAVDRLHPVGRRTAAVRRRDQPARAGPRDRAGHGGDAAAGLRGQPVRHASGTDLVDGRPWALAGVLSR